MFDSKYLQKPGKRLDDIEAAPKLNAEALEQLQNRQATILANLVYSYQVTTGADGLVKVDYSDLKLTKPPRITFVPKLVKATDSPVNINLVGDPTATSATIQVRKQQSVVGLLPTYAAVGGITVDVLIRPVAS